jgi:hypothetical protein
MWFKIAKWYIDPNMPVTVTNGITYFGDPNKKLPALNLPQQIKENQALIFQNPQQKEQADESLKNPYNIGQNPLQSGQVYNYNTYKMQNAYRNITDDTSMKIINDSLNRSKNYGDGWKFLNDEINKNSSILSQQQIQKLRADFKTKFQNITPPKNTEDAKIKGK